MQQEAARGSAAAGPGGGQPGRGGGRSPVPDFDIPIAENLAACGWWRPCSVSVDDALPEDPVVAGFLDELLAAFRQQGHSVSEQPSPSDVMLAAAEIPDGPAPLRERVPELTRPLLLAVPNRTGLRRRPRHFVLLVGISERLGDWAHQEVVETARAVMARLGSPKIVFLSGDRATGRVVEATYCTIEGGHPTERSDSAARIRDRIVAAACADEVGGRYRVEPDALPADAWTASPTPDALVAAGRRMDALGLLPAPQRISSYVSDRLAAIYERFLGLKGFSEGMLFAHDPATGTLMVTASGSWDVDKRALRRDEVVPLGDLDGEEIRVLAPEGVQPKGPSVEAWEVHALLEAAPRLRLRAESPSGPWRPDPHGPITAPIVRGGIHVHVGIRGADPAVVESLPANRQRFPYGFGCGTDLMCEVVRDVAERSAAMNDPDDPRAYVRWPMLYHGDTLVELWKPGVPETPLAGLLDLFEPAGGGALDYTPDHIEQPR